MPKTEYTLDSFKDIFEGKSILPNAEDVDPLLFLTNLASVGHSWTPTWGYAKMPDGHKSWTYFFLCPGAMGQGLDGRGHAVTYSSGRYDQEAKKMVHTPIVRRFALCAHERVGTGTQEQERRGYAPGHCGKCGLDMTVDSSD